MRAPKLPSSVTVIRPSVVAGIVYFGLCSVWAIYTLCTAKFPTIESTEPWRLLSTPLYLGVSAVNVVFALAFLLDWRKSLASPPELRRAHFVGLALAAIVLVLVQIGAHYAHSPITPN